MPTKFHPNRYLIDRIKEGVEPTPLKKGKGEKGIRRKRDNNNNNNNNNNTNNNNNNNIYNNPESYCHINVSCRFSGLYLIIFFIDESIGFKKR